MVRSGENVTWKMVKMGKDEKKHKRNLEEFYKFLFVT